MNQPPALSGEPIEVEVTVYGKFEGITFIEFED